MKLINLTGAWLLATLALLPTANAQKAFTDEGGTYGIGNKGSFFNAPGLPNGRLSLDESGFPEAVEPWFDDEAQWSPP